GSTMAGTGYLRRWMAGLSVAACVAALTTVLATGAAEAALPGATGSIAYDDGHNIILMKADGSATAQVTHGGTTPTADHTGGTGYSLPAACDARLVGAVRSQQETASDGAGFTRGYLWVMDRSGNVVRKVAPPQFNYGGGGSCPVPSQQLPLGIVNAVVSPDGA